MNISTDSQDATDFASTISIQKRISKKALFSESLVNTQSLVQPRESTDLTIIMGQGYTDMLKLRAK